MESISPRVDVAFKKIFGVEENKDLLMSLINSIVSLDDQVADLVLLNPYNPKNFANDKLSILDIKAQGHDGKKFNIEIQISDEADYDKRALYYWAKLYTEQLKSSEEYSTLCKAIGIHILNFISIPEVKNYHNVFHIREKESGLVYFKDLELHTIELKKFDNLEGDIFNKIKTSLDMWVAFLTRHDLLHLRKIEREALLPPIQAPTLQKALNVLDTISFDSQEREAYEAHLKWLRVEANTLRKYEAKGFDRGIQQGVLKAKQDMAITMIKEGFSYELITKMTGLSLKELQALTAS